MLTCLKNYRTRDLNRQTRDLIEGFRRPFHPFENEKYKKTFRIFPLIRTHDMNDVR